MSVTIGKYFKRTIPQNVGKKADRVWRGIYG